MNSLKLFQNISQNLPQDIINIILEFQGFYKRRKDKLYPQILDSDPRKQSLLEKYIPIKCNYADELMRYYGVTFYTNKIFDKEMDERRKYSIYITVLDTAFIWNMEVIVYKITPYYSVDIEKTLQKSCTYRQY
jgi:hypothetical protein